MASDEAPPLERVIVQWLLRSGLAISCALMALGFFGELASGTLAARTLMPAQIFSSGYSLSERLMGAGVLVLALTPALRVVALLLLWVKESDWRFVAVALAVVVTLCAAMLLGAG